LYELVALSVSNLDFRSESLPDLIRSRDLLLLERDVCRLLESVRLLRRPLISGLCSLIFLRVLRVLAMSGPLRLGSRSEGNEPSEEMDLLRFLSGVSMCALDDKRRPGWGRASRPICDDLEAFVDIVATDAEELDDVDRERFGFFVDPVASSGRSRFRPLSFSIFANCSSATPFLQRR
jgi:hypothetical protein